MKNRSFTFVTSLLFFGYALSANAQIVWDESVQGDLSSNRLAPSNLNLNLGTNGVIASTNNADVDYLHIHLSSGQSLIQLNLVTWSGIDQKGFIAVQSGSTFTEPSNGTNVANLLGYCHFGPSAGNLGKDLLPFLASGAGAIGFTPPLSGSDYTFWLNQTSPNIETYRLDFVVAPEPATMLWLGTSLVGILVKRKRRA